MIKILSRLLGFVLFLLTFPSCVFAETSSVTIGLVLPLTGPRASNGEEARAGATLALDDLRKEGVTGVSLVYEDSQANPKIGLVAVQKLLGENVQFLVTQNSNISLPAKKIISDAGAFQMAVSTTSDAYTSANDFSYRVNGDVSNEAKKFVEILSQKAGKVFIATMEDEYPIALRDTIEEMGYEGNLSDTFSPNESDFKSTLIKARTFETVVCLGFQTQCGVLVRQLRQLGSKAEVYCNVPINSQEFFTVADAAAEGVRVIYPTPNREHPSFDSYKERFGQEVSFFGASAYDGVYLLSKAIHTCAEKVSPLCVSENINRMKEYVGLSGHKTIHATTGDMTDTYSVLIAQQGKFVAIDDDLSPPIQ